MKQSIINGISKTYKYILLILIVYLWLIQSTEPLEFCQRMKAYLTFLPRCLIKDVIKGIALFIPVALLTNWKLWHILIASNLIVMITAWNVHMNIFSKSYFYHSFGYEIGIMMAILVFYVKRKYFSDRNKSKL